MRLVRFTHFLALIALAAATAPGALAAQDALATPESPPTTYAVALRARYLPLESVREGSVRMPKPLARKVTLRHEDVLLQQALLDIATQAGLGLSYGEDVARSATRVSLEVRSRAAADALADAVRGTRWSVLVNAAGQVIVVPAEGGQLGTVAGRVTDRATGQPLQGATVSLEGARLAAATGEDGRYQIRSVPPGTYALRVRRIGFESATRQVNVLADQETTADFALQAAPDVLAQVVVTGVPEATSRRSLGNAVTTIDVGEMQEKVSNANVTELLEGKAPGVSVQPGGGSPGTGASIRIRGAGSLVGGTAPVVYVDGVRIYTGAQGNFWNSWRSQRGGETANGAGQDAMALDMFRPEDIESIEVIKGPAAATLYGAEAANGVIQIITKKGTRGEQRTTWSAKAQVGRTDWAVDRPTNYTTCTPAAIASAFDDGSPRFPGCQGVAPGTILRASSLDLPGVLRTGAVRTYALSARGGGPGFSFYATGERSAEQGVFYNSANEQTGARANFSVHPSERVDLSVSFGLNRTRTQFPINDDGYGLIQAAMLYRPGYALPLGEQGREDGFEGGNGPLRIYQWDNQLRATRVTAGATVNHRPLGWLAQRLTIGVDQNNRLADKFLPPGSLWSGDGQAERGAPQNSLYTIDWAATASHLLPRALASAFSVGAQYTSNQFRNVMGRGTTFAPVGARDIPQAASTSSDPGPGAIDQKSLGFYAQERIGWNDRLYFTGALRVDNNSVFGDDIKSLVYPKLSAAWVISEEPFFTPLAERVDALKLRAAWGQAGNAPAPFAGQRSYTSATTVDENGTRVPGLRLNTIGNPEIKPERGSEIELGFDLSALANRVSFDFTYYNKTTKDALMLVPVAASTGFTGFRFENLGEINNRGTELAVTARPLDLARVAWESRLGFATNRNELVSFGDDRDPITLTLYDPVQRHQPGHPLGGYWGNFPQRDASGALVRDASGNLVASEARYIGPSSPTRELSFANTLTLFRHFRVFALLDYKGGHHLYNVKDQWRCHGRNFASAWNTDPAENIPGQCWEVNDPGRSDEAKEILQQPASVNNGLFIQRADFIKLRDVSVTWTMPERWSQRFGAQRTALTVAGHNLGFLWKPHYTGPDPDVNFTGVNDPGSPFAFIRVDSWTAPMTRRITTSLDFTF